MFRSFSKIYLLGIIIALILVWIGKVLVPYENMLGVIAATSILLVYGLVIYLNKINPKILSIIVKFGLIAGLIFAGEIISEYIFLPQDNSLYGLIEFGGVFIVYFFSSVIFNFKMKNFRSAILSTILVSMIATLVWIITILAVFYLFRGTPQQTTVFQAEGNYADFARSGKTDFNVFVIEDFMGAIFYHSLLGPIAALLLGAIGGLIVKGTIKILGFKKIKNRFFPFNWACLL